MIRFVEIGPDEKPKKTAGSVEVKAAPAADLAASDPKPAKRARKPSGSSKTAKR